MYFGKPGTTELPLMDAFLRAALKYVFALQEASAVAMATDMRKQHGGPLF